MLVLWKKDYSDKGTVVDVTDDECDINGVKKNYFCL